MTQKKKPQMTKEAIAEEIEFYKEIISDAEEQDKSGFYEREGIEAETVYSGRAMRYSGLGMAYALNEEWDKAKAAFKTAAEYKIRPILMAYELGYPEYVGEKIAEGAQAHNVADCFSYAMAAHQLTLAKKACMIFPEEWVPRNFEPDIVDNYVHALAAWFRGNTTEAAKICETAIRTFLAKPDKKITYRSNYYTLHLALWGICTLDQEAFDEGIQKQLAICHHDARYGEWKGMARGHFAEHALALTNLAIHAGLEQKIVDPFMPQGLVWE